MDRIASFCVDHTKLQPGEIPGASAVECGNYLMMDPIAARAEAAAMLPVLEKLNADQLHY